MGKRANRLKKLNLGKRGIVGIGVLIVFISTIIVATVAAGVLINTSVSLRGQARETAEDAVGRVSSGIEIVNITGETNENFVIENLSILVERRVGSQGIDLSRTTVQYSSPTTDKYLSVENVEDLSGGYPDSFFQTLEEEAYENSFAISKVRNPTETENHVIGPGADLSEIQIRPDVVEIDDIGIEAGQRIVITLIPDIGIQTVTRIRIPSTLEEEAVIDLW